MTTLSPSHETTVEVPALHGLTLVTAGSGSVVRLGDLLGADPYSPIELTAGSKVIGPFAIASRHRVRCDVGSINFSVSAADFPATTSDIERIVKLLQSEYDALDPVDPATLYVVLADPV
jgi:hypothetical protein